MNITNASQSLDELANGYNSGDEYTGQTGDNLTLSEWQEVSLYKRNQMNLLTQMKHFIQ